MPHGMPLIMPLGLQSIRSYMMQNKIRKATWNATRSATRNATWDATSIAINKVLKDAK
jgi:hypothetical protein